MRFIVGIEYFGANYCGWQNQKSGIKTVQFYVEKALSKVANSPIKVYCAGRTDKGVHALEQIIHFETNINRSCRSWLLGGNSFLPKDISFLWVKKVDDNFHARHSACARLYQYKIYNSITRPGLYNDYFYWEPKKLNIGEMQKAANLFLGKHDFSAFRSSICQAKSPIKTIEYLNINKNNNIILIDIKADSFLHHMVRNVVGTLLKVGYGRKNYKWVKEVINSKDRKLAGVTIAAKGLYFVKAFYAENLSL